MHACMDAAYGTESAPSSSATTRSENVACNAHAARALRDTTVAPSLVFFAGAFRNPTYLLDCVLPHTHTRTHSKSALLNGFSPTSTNAWAERDQSRLDPARPPSGGVLERGLPGRVRPHELARRAVAKGPPSLVPGPPRKAADVDARIVRASRDFAGGAPAHWNLFTHLEQQRDC